MINNEGDESKELRRSNSVRTESLRDRNGEGLNGYDQKLGML